MRKSAEIQRLRGELKRSIDQRDLFSGELAKVFQQFEEKVRELSVIRRIGESLKYAQDVRKVFEVIIDTIIEDTNAENCSLMLLNRETGELTVKAARGQTEAVSSYFHTTGRPGLTFRLGEGIAGWVAQHGEPLSIPDISTGAVVRFFQELDEQGEPVPVSDLSRSPHFVSASGSVRSIGSLLCLPLVIDKEVVGVVNMSHPRPFAFSPVDQRMMTIITDQVAIALNNVRVFDDLQHLNLLLEEGVNRATEELRRANLDLKGEISERERAEEALRVQTEELKTITDAMLAFLKNGKWREASDVLLGGALSLTGSEYGFVGVVVEGKALRIFPHEGLIRGPALNPGGSEKAPGTSRETDYLEITDFENLFGKVITSQEAIISNDPAGDSCSGGLPPGHPPMRRFLGAPILRGAEVIGMIGVANRPGGYTLTEQTRIEALSRAAGVLYDNYRRQEHEAALEQQLFQAQKMEAIGTLAGGIAHDFNNLLTNVIGFAELALLEPDDSGRWREYIARLPEYGQQAAKLISQLLAFSRRADTERQPLQLLHLVKETVKMLRRTVPEDVAIRLNTPEEAARVNADPTQMQQVLLNLCINASHAMPDGGELSISLENAPLDGAFCQRYGCASPGDYVCLSVRDTGVGMAPEVQARIFEPFFTTKGAGEGTGLGLAMVYGIVKAHEGHIHVNSEVGKGSEFRIYLPAMGRAAAPQKAVREAPVGGTETVLLVEDEEEVLDTGRAMLERLGYRVLTAANGEEALRVYRVHRPEIDLVLTDAVMPKMGGQALCAALRQVDPAVRALLMSGYSQKLEVADLRASGLRGFVQKPFNVARLGRAVRQALDET